MHPYVVIVGLWVAWASSWVLAAMWAAQTEKRPRLRSELGYRVVLLAGSVIFAVRAHRYEGPLRLWHINWVGAWTCVVLIGSGFVFCWWARIHLGRLWSGRVTRKSGHRIIGTGPYAMVRHPIYTGLLASVYATAAAKGTILGLAGAALLTLGFWMKARLEERWLAQELGNAYSDYRRRVPMLLPWPRPRI